MLTLKHILSLSLSLFLAYTRTHTRVSSTKAHAHILLKLGLEGGMVVLKASGSVCGEGGWMG